MVPDRGLVGEIMNDQLGFELITHVYLGSTAWRLRGSPDKESSSIEQPGLFCPGPCGTMTPLRLVPHIEGIRRGEIYTFGIYPRTIVGNTFWTKKNNAV